MDTLDLPETFKLSHSLRNKYRDLRDLQPDDQDWIEPASQALAAVRAAHEAVPDAVVGVVSCTKCETGQILWTVNAHNGRMHGSCTTPGCLQFME